ncbi:MCE family protein [Actinomadura sp. GC306]|uniref:MlaD family protein n=1 Tax=Actinomadura sp. GC306 TaxID=2530367 RepID=UPI00104294E4|nr:MCE family protein [Actinomadura sp. GC306]TDC70733.1 MCE family protein [Actinomadura sp. GC306]
MSRRIVANLVVFGLVGLLLTGWALRNVIVLNVPERYYGLRVEFESSPGLQPGFDVAYLGVAVGKIRSVRLAGRKVVAELDIDRGQPIPGNAVAVAGRKSAIGEPYVSLELPPGATGAAPLPRDAVIPLSRTSVAASYDELFTAANEAVTGLNADDLRTFSRELAAGWDGRSDSLQKMLDGAGQLTGTFAENTALIDGLIGEMTATTGLLTAKRGELAGGLHDFSLVMAALARNEKDLKRLTEEAPGLLDRFNAILSQTRRQNDCTLKNLGTVLPVVLDDRSIRSLEYAEAHAPELVKVLRMVAPPDEEPASLHIDFVITDDKTPPAPEYKNLKPLPDVGEIPGCAGVRVPVPGRAKASGDDKAPAEKPAAGAGAGEGDTAVRNTSDVQDRPGPSPWLVYLPPLIALAILILTTRRALVVAWQNLRRRTPWS